MHRCVCACVRARAHIGVCGCVWVQVRTCLFQIGGTNIGGFEGRSYEGTCYTSCQVVIFMSLRLAFAGSFFGEFFCPSSETFLAYFVHSSLANQQWGGGGGHPPPQRLPHHVACLLTWSVCVCVCVCVCCIRAHDEGGLPQGAQYGGMGRPVILKY